MITICNWRTYTILLSVLVVMTGSIANAELLGEEWISEADVKKQSAFARNNGLILNKLGCKFREGVENPGREDVIFRADFDFAKAPIGWGWTFDANAPLLGPEKQARAAGLEVVHEEYSEISGVTWVRCKVWHQTQ